MIPEATLVSVDPLDATETYREVSHPPTVAKSMYLCHLRNRVSRYARDGALSMDDLERIEERAQGNLRERMEKR